MSTRIDHVVSDLEQVTRNIQAAFGHLSHDQLNWQPTSTRWSIAQCLEHLITTNQLYFPMLTAVATGIPTPTAWERYSPLSGLFGWILVRSVDPMSTRKLKTLARAEPSRSGIDADIVDRFIRHQDELIGLVRRIPEERDLARTIVTSPLARWVTYSLNDCLTILSLHEQRHAQQARRVVGTGGFPHTVGQEAA